MAIVRCPRCRDEVTVPPRAPGSVEGVLAAAGDAFAFVDYRRASGVLRQAQAGALADFGVVRGDWPEVFDGLFFISRVWPVERTGK